MATTESAETSCPCCGRPTYAFRVPVRFDDEMNLCRYFRCGTDGRYVYVHEIAFRNG